MASRNIDDGEKLMQDFNVGLKAIRASGEFDRIVATQDWHPMNHGSFAANHKGKRVLSLANLGGLPQVLWPILRDKTP